MGRATSAIVIRGSFVCEVKLTGIGVVGDKRERDEGGRSNTAMKDDNRGGAQ
jgi:hypothetical protein